jgi:hypothetical protein
MKLKNILLGLIFIFSASFICINPSLNKKTDINCQTIIDSASILIQTGDFGINIKPTIDDNNLSLRLDKWFRSLSFKNLTCLLNNENLSYKFLGATYAAMFHQDSLIKNYSYLLSDTTSVQIYMARGQVSPKMKFGELISTLIQGVKKDDENFARRPEIEKKVSKFITEYSTYPTTYKPISFPYFSMSSENLNEHLAYNIRHAFDLKNNAGKLQRVTYAFVLDSMLRINVIEKDSSSFTFSYPSKLEDWFKEFGRKLTKNDSLSLGLR